MAFFTDWRIGWLSPRSGLDREGNLAPTEIRPQDRPAGSR